MDAASYEHAVCQGCGKRILHEHRRKKQMCFCDSAKEFKDRHTEDVLLTKAGLYAAVSP